MDQIKKILAPTDFSELSQAGVRYALHLAQALGAEVTIYHVVNYEEITAYREWMEEGAMANSTFRPPQQLLERCRLALDQFLKDHFSDLMPWVKVHKKVELGVPYKNIVEEAKREGADLIVLATHGRTGLSHALLGSVTEKVVRNAPCPVLSIRPQLAASAAQKAA